MSASTTEVRRLARFSVTTQHTERLVAFWADAFGCREVSRANARPGRPGCVRLTLGSAIVDVIEYAEAGRPYPPGFAPFDNAFQHFAIVVSDMARAYTHLCATPGWTAITSAGPQRLPASSGGVTAFKFRDPDGHPLELLSFPADATPSDWQPASAAALFLGIDHSALSVADTARSVAFYRGLGLHVVSQSFNHGIEQELLDGVPDPRVDVVGLAPREHTPHVELLCYRNVSHRRVEIHENDVFASRLVFEGRASVGNAGAPIVLVDPDGHHLEISGDQRIDS